MADEEMRDVIEEVGEDGEPVREGLAPDDDFAEADASAGESDDDEDQEEFDDDEDDVEVRLCGVSGWLMRLIFQTVISIRFRTSRGLSRGGGGTGGAKRRLLVDAGVVTGGKREATLAERFVRG